MANKEKKKELNLEPIEEGTLVKIMNGMTRPSMIGKVIKIIQEENMEYYLVITPNSRRARKYRRKELALAKDFNPIVDTTLLKAVLKYKKGTNVQIFGNYLYIGGDDIMMHADIARNKEII